MTFQSIISRLAAVALVLLSLGYLVQASPIAVSAPAPGKEVAIIEKRSFYHCAGGYCYGGLGLLDIMLRLQVAINLKLTALNLCRLKGGDYKPIILDIERTICAAIDAIRECKLGYLDLLSGRLLLIAKVWFTIVITAARYCGYWVKNLDFDDFLCFAAKLDCALRDCYLAMTELGGIHGRFYGLCLGLFARLHINLLIQAKFTLCLAALKLGGY